MKAAGIIVFIALCGAATAGATGMSPKQELGKKIFFDKNLSINANQSCATCHAPEVGWTGPDTLQNSKGGVYRGSIPERMGNRKPPSSAYVTQSPVLHFNKKEKVFVGGNFWDGRATGARLKNPAAEQAQGPFLNALEHGFADAACVVNKVCSAPYGAALDKLWPGSCAIAWPADITAGCGTDNYKAVLPEAERAKVDLAYDRIALAIADYEGSAEVNSFSSRFDAWRAGKGTLTAQEQLGFKLFNVKGKCAKCHLSKGTKPLFTDFTYDNLGIPRNPGNPFYTQTAYNPEGASWVDPGLGVFLATEKAYRSKSRGHYGAHKVPTLRNVDKRPSPDVVKVYGHNGYFKSLKEIVHFYNTRDTLPVCNPGDPGERVTCWPVPETALNMNSEEMGNLKLTDAEEDAIVAFMKTLNDGEAAR
jgi:cytochrome c peroxidase